MENTWNQWQYLGEEDDSRMAIYAEHPGDVDIIREGNKRGQRFKEFMQRRGFRIERYQYKVVTSWRDQAHFSRSIGEHIRDFEYFERNLAESAEAAKTARKKRMKTSFNSKPHTLGNTSRVPVVIPSHEEKVVAEFQPFDFYLLHQLLPEDYCSNPETLATKQANSLYEPLPGEGWVRLLIIEPRLMPGFRCHMRNVELNNALGRYEALSYRWEDSENDRHADMSKLDGITCNGFPMMLKRNLHLALTNLRYRVRPRILWIDAICINQDDAKERSRQVELMGTIYRHSSRTIIWLGNIRQDDSVKAFNAVCQLVNNWSNTYSASYSTKCRGNLQLKAQRYKFQGSDFEPLFKASWFERRWVIQEVVLAQNAIVMVPGATIAWDWIALAAAILRTNHLNEMRAYGVHTNVCNAYLMARLSGRMGLPALEINFLHLLRLTTEFKTTGSSLDTVFALLGLVPDISDKKEEFFISVDYSWTEDELMRRTAEKFMKLPEPLAFLSDAVGAWRDSDYNGPSWIPNYGPKDYAMLDPWALVGSSFNPARTLPFRRRSSESDFQLTIDGICFSYVVWKGACFSDVEQIDRTMDQLFILMQHIKPNIDDLEKLTLLSRTITGGRDSYGSRSQNRSNYARDFADFLLEWQKCFDVEPHLVTFTDMEELARTGQYSRFLDVATVICGRRSLFVTASGHIGLGPEAVQVGDVVCALGGATMLHVLRSTDDRYRLIGDCFADNLMDGEIVAALNQQAVLSGPVSTTEFLESVTKWSNKRTERIVTSGAAVIGLPDIVLAEASATSDIMAENPLKVCPITIV